MSEHLAGLDAWIQGEPPDPGSGNGRTEPLWLRCDVCGDHRPFKVSVAHWLETGHPQRYKGTVQDFSRVPR